MNYSYVTKSPKSGTPEFVSGLISELHLTPASVIYSLGTNNGAELMPLARLGAEIHCFEPHPAYKPDLEEAFKDFPNVHLNFAAVWCENTKQELLYKNQYRAKNGGASLIIKQFQGSEILTDTVDCIDIAEYIKTHSNTIDVMFMDVEGAEYIILEHLLDTRVLSSIAHIYFEDHYAKLCKTDMPKELSIYCLQLLDVIRNLGIELKPW